MRVQTTFVNGVNPFIVKSDYVPPPKKKKINDVYERMQGPVIRAEALAHVIRRPAQNAGKICVEIGSSIDATRRALKALVKSGDLQVVRSVTGGVVQHLFYHASVKVCSEQTARERITDLLTGTPGLTRQQIYNTLTHGNIVCGLTDMSLSGYLRSTGSGMKRRFYMAKVEK